MASFDEVSPVRPEEEYSAPEDSSDICKRLTFSSFAPAPPVLAVASSQPTGAPSTVSNATHTNVVKDDCRGEALHCFLRIRPMTEPEQRSTAPMTNIDLFDDGQQIEIHAPEDSATFKNGSRNPADNSWRFTFSSVLCPTAGQQDVFETTMLENVQDFVTGQNTLVFTYGATNGGKTYTMLGKPSDAGLIPRTLDTIFNSIKDRLGTSYEMKPKCMTLVRLDDASRVQELKNKQDVLASWDKNEETFSSADISCSSILADESLIPNAHSTAIGDTSLPLPGAAASDDVSLSFVPEVDTNRQRDVRTRVSIEPQGKVRFSVFVSYAEIYNEMIFDLLDKPPLTKQGRRAPLKLVEDKSKRHHIKGLKEIEVRNADEAFKLLQIGQINRQVASTRLNQRSSRSHAIFTVKVLRVVDINDPTYARVSSMSFVDLAGSERNREKEGLRMKEACNINTSLLTLGKCIEIMRYNQRNRCSHQRLVPFRESKLTRLFMSFFQGEGRVTMIVNINQISAMFDETYRVLRFSALAREVVPGGPRQTRPGGKAARDAEQADGQKAADMEVGKLSAQHDSEIEEYRRIVQSLRDELRKARIDKIEMEVDIRREAAEEMAQQLIEIEESSQERVAEAVSALEERHEQQLEILSKSIKRRYVQKRRRPDSDDLEASMATFRGKHDAEKWQSKCKELEEEKMQVEDELSERIKQLEREKSVLQYELSDKMEDVQQLDKLKRKNALLEQSVADLTQKLSQEKARYCNLQDEVGRMRHETNEGVQRKNAMAATIEGQTRELVKTRAEVMQLRHSSTSSVQSTQSNSSITSSRCRLPSAQHDRCQQTEPAPTAAELQAVTRQLQAAHAKIGQQDRDFATELERAQAKIGEQRAEHATQLEALQAKMTAEVETVQAKIAQQTTEYTAEVEALHTNIAQQERHHAAELESVQFKINQQSGAYAAELEAAQAKINQQEEEFAAMLQAARAETGEHGREHAAELERTQAKISEREREPTAELEVAQSKISELESEHTAELKTAQMKISELENEHTAELKMAQTKIGELERQHVAELDIAQANVAEVKREYMAKLETALAKVNEQETDHAAEVERAQAKISERDRDHAAEVARATSTMAEMSNTLRAAQENLNTYEQDLSELRSALAHRDAELRALDARYEAQCRRIAELEDTNATEFQQSEQVCEDHMKEINGLNEQIELIEEKHRSALAGLNAAVSNTMSENDALQTRLQTTLDEHETQLEQLSTELASTKSKHDETVKDLETRLMEISNTSDTHVEEDVAENEPTTAQTEAEETAEETDITTTTGSAVAGADTDVVTTVDSPAENTDVEDSVPASQDIEDEVDKENMIKTTVTSSGNSLKKVATLRVKATMSSCGRQLASRVTRSSARKNPTSTAKTRRSREANSTLPSANPLLGDSLILDDTLDMTADVSMAGEDVVDPALVYDMETSAHEERDVTPGVGKKRKRFARQCKRSTKEAASAGAKRAKRNKDSKASDMVDGDSCSLQSSTGNSVSTAASIVSILTSPFSKSATKTGSSSSAEGKESPLSSAPARGGEAAARPRTRRRLIEKNQISSPISIAGCGPGMELTSRRNRRQV